MGSVAIHESGTKERMWGQAGLMRVGVARDGGAALEDKVFDAQAEAAAV